MNIMESMRHSFGGFALDSASIGNTSASKTQIVLPYTGQLPAELDDNTGAAIVVTLQVGLTVNVLLTVERDKKTLRYPVTVAPEEIDRILQPFFFTGDGHTRRDNGLEPYSMGLHQGSYTNWKRLTLEPDGFDNLLFQLSPVSVERVLQHIRHSETA